MSGEGEAGQPLFMTAIHGVKTQYKTACTTSLWHSIPQQKLCRLDGVQHSYRAHSGNGVLICINVVVVNGCADEKRPDPMYKL